MPNLAYKYASMATLSMVMPDAIISPLSDMADKWELALRGHQDIVFREYISKGLRQEFRIGFDYVNHRCVSANGNLPSVAIHPLVVQEYLRECEAGRVVGPLPPGSIPNLQVSPFVA